MRNKTAYHQFLFQIEDSYESTTSDTLYYQSTISNIKSERCCRYSLVQTTVYRRFIEKKTTTWSLSKK